MTLSKFSTKPSSLHYHYLKGNAKFLCLTKDWDNKFKHTTEHPELEVAKFRPEVILNEKLPALPVDINQPKLMAFVDAVYASDHQTVGLQTGLYLLIVMVQLCINPGHK